MPLGGGGWRRIRFESNLIITSVRLCRRNPSKAKLTRNRQVARQGKAKEACRFGTRPWQSGNTAQANGKMERKKKEKKASFMLGSFSACWAFDVFYPVELLDDLSGWWAGVGLLVVLKAAGPGGGGFLNSGTESRIASHRICIAFASASAFAFASHCLKRLENVGSQLGT